MRHSYQILSIIQTLIIIALCLVLYHLSVGDLNLDRKVDLADFSIMIYGWRE